MLLRFSGGDGLGQSIGDGFFVSSGVEQGESFVLAELEACGFALEVLIGKRAGEDGFGAWPAGLMGGFNDFFAELDGGVHRLLGELGIIADGGPCFTGLAEEISIGAE